MRKSVKAWLEEIPQKTVRDRALQHTGAADGREWADCLSTALKHAFVWHRSAEGFGYWCDVYMAILETEKLNSTI